MSIRNRDPLRLSWAMALMAALALSGRASAAPRSVVVLPFENLTGVVQNAWIGTGLAETLSQKLGAVADLRVSDRQSTQGVLQAREVNLAGVRAGDAAEIGKLQGVDAVLLGSVQMAQAVEKPEAPLVITARTVDVATGRVGNAIELRGQMKHLFELQNRLAFAFLDRLGLHPDPAEREGVERHGTPSLEAYRFYAIGLAYVDAGQYLPAVQAFEKAMSKHPGILYAEAHHELIQAYLRGGRKQEALARARKTVADRAPLFYDLGLAAERAGRWEEAIQAYRTFLTYCDRRRIRWRYVPSPAPKVLAAADERAVFLAGPDGGLTLLDAGSGALRWMNGDAPGVSAALLSGGVAYVSTNDGALLTAYDAGTPRLLWRREIKGDPVTALSATGDVLFAICGGTRVRCLRAADGSDVWEYALPGRLAARPAPHPTALFLAAEAGQVVGLSATDGKVLWQQDLKAKPLACAVGGTTLYCAAEGKLAALRLLDGKERWSRKLAEGVVPGIAVAGGRVALVTDGGEVCAFAAETGEDAWQRSGVAALPPSGSGATLFAGTPDGAVLALAADTGEPRWRYPTPERGAITPLAAGETVYAVGRGGSVCAIDAALSKGPSDLDGYLHLAATLASAGKKAEAIPLWRYVAEVVQPDSPDARLALAQAYRSLGRTAEAERQEALVRRLPALEGARSGDRPQQQGAGDRPQQQGAGVVPPGKAPAAAARPSAEKPLRMAVLPFQNLVGDAAFKQLGEWLAEIVTTELGQVKGIELVERAQIDRVMGEVRLENSGLFDPGTVAEIGKQLGVPYVVVGSCMKAGDVIAITTRRVEVESGKVLETARSRASADPERIFDDLPKAAHALRAALLGE